MAPKTEAELALQRKYEELRKKKEAKLKAKQSQDAAPKAEQPKQQAHAAPVPQPAVKPSVPTQLPGLTARKPAAPPSRPQPAPKAAAAAAAPEVPGETAKQRAIRLLAAKRASAGGRTGGGGGGGAAAAAQRKPAATAAATPADAGSSAAAPGRQPPPAEQAQSPADGRQAADGASARPDSEATSAAKKAARQGLDGGGGAAKRPGIKRPTSHRPAARDEADGKRARPGGGGGGLNPTSDAGRDGGAQPAQQRFEPRDAPGDDADDERRSTLFVGDLPPHYDSGAVQAVFSDLAPVVHARVVGTQCYAFVRFQSPGDADHVMQRTREAPLELEDGRQLRVNWAHGQLPDWKQGSQLVRERGAPGLEQYEHPKVREARLAAQAAADAFDPEALAEVELRPPPRRALVVYDDL